MLNKIMLFLFFRLSKEEKALLSKDWLHKKRVYRYITKDINGKKILVYTDKISFHENNLLYQAQGSISQTKVHKLKINFRTRVL